jgi:hypothetical protein
MHREWATPHKISPPKKKALKAPKTNQQTFTIFLFAFLLYLLVYFSLFSLFSLPSSS